jgi:hypothetical protein
MPVCWAGSGRPFGHWAAGFLFSDVFYDPPTSPAVEHIKLRSQKLRGKRSYHCEPSGRGVGEFPNGWIAPIC